MAVRCTQFHYHCGASRNESTQEVPVRWSRIITQRAILPIVDYGRDDGGAGKSVSMPLFCPWKRERSYLLLVAETVLLADPFRLSDTDADVRPPAAPALGVAGLEALLAPLIPPAEPVSLAGTFILGNPDAGTGPPASLPIEVALEALLEPPMLLAGPVSLVDPFTFWSSEADKGPPASPLVVAGLETLLAIVTPTLLPLEAPMPVSTGQKSLSLMDTVTVVTDWASISVALLLKSARTANESPSQVFILQKEVEAQDSEQLY